MVLVAEEEGVNGPYELWWVTDKDDRLFISSCPQLAQGFSIDTGYWLQFPVVLTLDDTERCELTNCWGGDLTSTRLLVDTAMTLAAKRFLGRGIN